MLAIKCIVHIKGSQVRLSIEFIGFAIPNYFNLTRLCRPDEMQHSWAFHLFLHCLPRYISDQDHMQEMLLSLSLAPCMNYISVK